MTYMYMTTIIIHSTRRIVTCFQLSSWFFIPSQAPPFTCHFQRTSPRCEEHHRSTCTIAILFAKVTIVSCSTEGSNWNEMLFPPFHLIVGKGSIRTLPIERKTVDPVCYFASKKEASDFCLIIRTTVLCKMAALGWSSGSWRRSMSINS